VTGEPKEIVGFEDGSIKPFWIRKDSEDVFKGSYSGKDWRHVGDGAWEPKPRKPPTKKHGGKRGRGRGRGGTSKSVASKDQSAAYYPDQTCTADSEKCAKSAGRERVVYRKGSEDGQTRGRLEKTRSVGSVQENMKEEKSLDCGSQSDVQGRTLPSDESFPAKEHVEVDNGEEREPTEMDCNESKSKQSSDQVEDKRTKSTRDRKENSSSGAGKAAASLSWSEGCAIR